MLPNRIKILLDSEDIEMVRLGAEMMKGFSKPDDWPKILEAFSFADAPYDLWLRKWTYEIIGDIITISPNVSVHEMWRMNQKVDAPLLNMTTSNIMKFDSETFKFELPCQK